MSGTLAISSKVFPFPFAAAAIASYTQKADLVFDETNTIVSLTLDGSKITDEHEIVHALAKAGGIFEGSAKVK